METATAPKRARQSEREILRHEFLTIAEVALLLRVTQRTVYNLIYSGSLRATKITARITVIPKEDFMNMIRINEYNRANGLDRQKGSGYTLLIGTSYGSQKSNVAKTKARNNAINEFAEYGKSIVKARINTKVDDIDGDEVDNIVTGYERMVVRELDEILPMPSLVLRRDNNGSYDYQCYYMINEQALRKAQKKAVEEAIEQSGLAAKYGNSISDFINSGFNEK